MDKKNAECKSCGNDTFNRRILQSIQSGVRVFEGAEWPGTRIKSQYFCSKCGEELKPAYDEWGDTFTP